MDYCALQQMDDEIDIVMNELDPNERLSPRGTLYEGVWFFFRKFILINRLDTKLYRNFFIS